MPYIPDANRKEVDPQYESRSPRNPGELNYVFTTLIKRYLEDQEISYQTINDVMGALEGAKLEFYRRVAVPYENTKLSLNGDAY
jgi:hypothetical protein